MCSENSGYIRDQINGDCPDCGEPTVDGDVYNCCLYSPTECKICGW